MSKLEFDFLGRDNVFANTVYDPIQDEKYTILKLKLDNTYIDEPRIKKVKVIIDYWDTDPTKEQYRENLLDNEQAKIFKQIYNEGFISKEDYEKHMRYLTAKYN